MLTKRRKVFCLWSVNAQYDRKRSMIDMVKKLLSVNIVIIILLLFGCSGRSKIAFSTAGQREIPFSYAENIKIYKNKDYTIAQLRNPWDTTKVLHTYVLVDNSKTIPDSLPNGTVIRTPLSKSIVYSSVHCSLLIQLHALSAIKGICDLDYIFLDEIHKGVADGQIADIGNSMSPAIEKVIDLHPDAILLSPFQNSGGYGRIEKLNIPILECADYMETSALGRAEWMKFYGILFGKEAEADSLFAQIEKNYKKLMALARSDTKRPTVLSDLKSSSAWYVPGGRSTTGKIYDDANSQYIFSHTPNSGTIPMAFETVYDKGHNADCWIIKYTQPKDKTLSELKADVSAYTKFKAFRDGEVYGCNTGRVRFYEEVPFHPDYLLQDLIKILHPSLLSDYDLKYFRKLAEN